MMLRIPILLMSLPIMLSFGRIEPVAPMNPPFPPAMTEAPIRRYIASPIVTVAPVAPVVAKVVVKTTADNVPEWIRMGILATETRSYYYEDNSIEYVDKRRGAAGEIGPFQIRRCAFNMVKKRGESFWTIEKNPKFAEEVACRYLLYLYEEHAHRNWKRTVMMYNMGPHGKNTEKGTLYYNSVKKNGQL